MLLLALSAVAAFVTFIGVEVVESTLASSVYSLSVLSIVLCKMLFTHVVLSDKKECMICLPHINSKNDSIETKIMA